MFAPGSQLSPNAGPTEGAVRCCVVHAGHHSVKIQSRVGSKRLQQLSDLNLEVDTTTSYICARHESLLWRLQKYLTEHGRPPVLPPSVTGRSTKRSGSKRSASEMSGIAPSLVRARLNSGPMVSGSTVTPLVGTTGSASGSPVGSASALPLMLASQPLAAAAPPASWMPYMPLYLQAAAPLPSHQLHHQQPHNLALPPVTPASAQLLPSMRSAFSPAAARPAVWPAPVSPTAISTSSWPAASNSNSSSDSDGDLSAAGTPPGAKTPDGSTQLSTHPSLAALVMLAFGPEQAALILSS